MSDSLILELGDDLKSFLKEKAVESGEKFFKRYIRTLIEEDAIELGWAKPTEVKVTVSKTPKDQLPLPELVITPPVEEESKPVEEVPVVTPIEASKPEGCPVCNGTVKLIDGNADDYCDRHIDEWITFRESQRAKKSKKS